MAEIAERYPEPARQRYLDAVKEFRLPYWDYFRPRREERTDSQDFRKGSGYNFNVPLIFTTAEIVVRLPSNDEKLVKYSNPLSRFMCPSKEDGGFNETDKEFASNDENRVRVFRCTVRNPRHKDDDEGNSVGMNAIMNGAQMRQPYTMFIRDRIIGNQRYESFATKDLTEDDSGNLESIHDQYHGNLAGGNFGAGYNGWMGAVPTAAFDPVFWMHHW